MNNEFNNQNMNQFQNSNMNNEYSSNYNNLNNNKSNNNGLIVMLVIIIIVLTGLCVFFALDKKDNNLDGNKVNDQEQEKDNSIQENEKPEALNCIFDGELVQGAEYVNGQYTYRYMQEYTQNRNGVTEWINISQNGWGVILTDKESTEPVTTKLCSAINGKPIVSMSYMFNERKGTLPYGAVMDFPCQSTSIDLSSFDTSNVTNMMGMFHLNNVTTLDLSGFDISNVTNMTNIFLGDELTIVYAKNQEDADRFNTSMGKPVTLKIVVK